MTKQTATAPHNRYESISATELARHTASNIDRVRLSGRKLFITKGNQKVAQLCPLAPQKGFNISDLPNLLASLPTLGDDRKAMAKDLKSIRDKAKLPRNPWE